MQVSNINSINKVDPIKIVSNPIKKVSDAISNSSNIARTVTGATVAAVGGEYLVKKALERNELKQQMMQIGLGENLSNTLLSLKEDSNEPVFTKDKKSLQSMALVGRYYPNIFKMMLKYPNEIKECKYVPANQNTHKDSYFSTKLGNVEIEITLSGRNLLSQRLKVKNPDGSESTNGKEWIQGTNKYRNLTETKDIKGVTKRISSTPYISDINGIIHHNIVETVLNQKGKVEKVTKIESDNSKTIINCFYDYKGRQSETITKQYSSNGELAAETKTVFEYQENNLPIIGKQENKILKHRQTIDYRNNTIEQATYSVGKYDDIEKEVFQIKNNKTNKVKTEIIEKSSVKHLFNSKIIDEAGNEKIETIITKDKNGYINIEKHTVSLDGTKTDYIYRNSSKEDDMQMTYKITSKDGEVLTNVDRKFKRITSGKSYSSINGHDYSITKNSEGLEIRDLISNQIRNIKYTDIISQKNNDEYLARGLISRIPADLILHLADNGIKIIMTNDSSQARYKADEKIIVTLNDISAFAHELGHSKDVKWENNTKTYNITTDSNFRTIYEKEKALFLKSFSEMQKNKVDYFINELASYGGPNGAPAELVAEANAILTGCIPIDTNAIRMNVLQKYFPQSIAAASKLLNKNYNISLDK